MELWESIRNLLFSVSVALNVILLFFQKAINQIIGDWWKDRRQSRKEKEDRLHELHRHMSSYPSSHYTMMLRTLIAEKLQTDMEVQEHLAAVQQIGHRMQEIEDFIGANELRFSAEIQYGLKRFREQRNIADVMAVPQRITERHRLVAEVCDQLKEQLEQELRRL